MVILDIILLVISSLSMLVCGTYLVQVYRAGQKRAVIATDDTLIEHIQHARPYWPDLRCEANAAGLLAAWDAYRACDKNDADKLDQAMYAVYRRAVLTCGFVGLDYETQTLRCLCGAVLRPC